MFPRLLPLLLLLAPASAAELPVRVPAGFEAAQVAGPELANDIYTMTIDATGRLAVAGRGYVRQIADGKATDLATVKDGPMGLLWEGDVLYTVVDGGVWKQTPAGKTLILKIKTGGEHDAHAIRRGADGKLYLLCGNNAGVSAKTATAKTSPITNPVAGALLRFNDDGTEVEIVADGFRNAYDFDFNLAGVPHTFDSDNERCVGLPWYEHTRFYEIKWGGNYGWLNPQVAQTWRKPPYYPDVVRPLATLGRGSPTGCVCYRHTQFPKRYQGGFFLADWTFGKVWVVPPGGKPEVFLEPRGDSGFAPTALTVHPRTGELYVSIGGRGTRGGVYRVRATDGPTNPRPLAIRPAPIGEPAPAADRALVEIRDTQRSFGDLVDPKLVGTVWEGYSFRQPADAERRANVLSALHDRFPTKDADLNRELSRTLAALADDDPTIVRKAVAFLTKDSDSIEDVHYLIVLGRLTGKRTPDDTARIADALVTLDTKFEAKKILRDRHWPLRLGEATAALLKHDPALEAAILKHPQFGQAAHAWLAKLLDKPAAARRIAGAAKATADYEWSAELVGLLAALPDAEVRPLLPKLAARGGLTDALVPLFARSPTADDRPHFVAGLQSYQPATVARSAAVLAKLPADDREFVPAVQALRRLGDAAGDKNAKAAVVELLQQRTGQKHTTAKEWADWLTATKPALAKALTPGGVDPAAWAKRATAVAWDAGDAAAGKVVFAKASCAACHNGAQAIGPSLEGVTKRFSRDDLLTAIVDPNKDVSPRYRTTEVNTRDGKTYRGVVIYEATDGVILHLGTTETVRVSGDNIESQRTRDTSLMPVGLLDPLSDREVADLVAYLRSLKGGT